jgi:glutathione S-transferase
LFPGSGLFGEGPKGQAFVEMWQRRIELQFLYPVAQAFRHIHPAMKEWEVPQIQDWGEANKPKAARFAELLNDHLKEHRFVCGDTFTLADITAIIAVDFSKVARISYDDKLTDLHRWVDEVRSRPSYSL